MRLKIKADVAVVMTGEEAFVMRRVAGLLSAQGEANKVTVVPLAQRERVIVQQFGKNMDAMSRFHEMVAEFYNANSIEDQHDE